MNEYRIAVPKGDIKGFSGDPNQNVSNAQSPDLNRPLTIQDGANIALAATYGKKVLNAGYSAVVEQIGDGDLEMATFIGQKVLTYVGIGLLTGGTGVVLALGAEAVTTGINYAVSGHKINLDNEIKVAERGTRRKFGVTYYD